MWRFLKFIIWIAALLMLNYLILNYFGYTFNKDFFRKNVENCKKVFAECKKENEKRAEQGIGNTKCDYYCLSNDLIIAK